MIKNIAVSGDIGTGKSTLAKNLAKRLGWKYISAGEYFRKWHKERGIPLEESGEVPEELDKQFDEEIKNKLEREPNIVYEAHLGGFIAKELKDTFKILCTASEEEALTRAAKRDGITFEESKRNAQERRESNKEKFKRIYGVENYLKIEYFNLAVDTTNLSPEQVLERALKEINEQNPS